MGGVLSGRYGQRSGRLCVEDTLAIDVGVIIRPTLAAHATRADATLKVNRRRIVIDVDLRAGSMSIEYPKRGQTETSPLVALAQPFGGVRWLASCPRCGRRCRKLYLPNYPAAALACRRCHGLAYRCQRISTADRWQQRATRLYAKVGTDPQTLYHLKPKWMRWHTFSRTVKLARDYDTASFNRRTEGLLRRFGMLG